MAAEFSLEVESRRQGWIAKPHHPRKGWEDTSECFGFDYEVTAPFDAGYQVTPRHKRAAITRPVDSASLKLY